MWRLACVLALGQTPPPLSPADAVAQAHADAARLPAELRVHVRYLSLYNLRPAERPRAIQVLAGHVNGLSRESDLTPPAIVASTQGALLRVNLLDYRWAQATWEKLADPYFTVTIETVAIVPWPGGIWPDDGKHYRAGSFKVKEPKKTRALAPWLTETPAGQQRLGELLAWTGSKIPVVRADWFFNQTAAAVDRSPNYYDFLAIRDEAGFQKAIGADLKLAEDFGAELREAVAISGVTLNPRAIARHPTLAGGYWRTFDFAASKDQKNPLRVLGKDIEKAYDASEQFGTLPNGLWATGLFNRQGKLQATAPDNIASDGASRSNDRRVHVNASCLRCHAQGGLQDVDGWARNLLTPPFDLLSADYQRIRELRRQYLRKLEPALAKDRLIFETAVREVTGGMTAKEYAAAYGAFWERYEDARIDLERAAAELGISPAMLRTALDRKLKTGQGDTVLSALILTEARLNRLPIRIWEEAFAEAQLLVKGYQP